jgi:hypothetical protein
MNAAELKQTLSQSMAAAVSVFRPLVRIETPMHRTDQVSSEPHILGRWGLQFERSSIDSGGGQERRWTRKATKSLEPSPG